MTRCPYRHRPAVYGRYHYTWEHTVAPLRIVPPPHLPPPQPGQEWIQVDPGVWREYPVQLPWYRRLLRWARGIHA